MIAGRWKARHRLAPASTNPGRRNEIGVEGLVNLLPNLGFHKVIQQSELGQAIAGYQQVNQARSFEIKIHGQNAATLLRPARKPQHTAPWIGPHRVSGWQRRTVPDPEPEERRSVASRRPSCGGQSDSHIGQTPNALLQSEGHSRES